MDSQRSHQIKNNKTKNAQIQSNTVVGHPKGEQRTLSHLVGPDSPCVLEEEEDGHVHGGLDDLHEHLELQQHIMRMDIVEEHLEFDMELEQSAHDELDEVLRMGLKHKV